MEQVLQLVVVFFAALATGALMVNWIGLGLAMSRLSAPTYVEPHASASTSRSRAGQFRAHPMTGRSFAPSGFDFTFSALFFRFRHWLATFLPVLSVDDLRCTGFRP